ncbi:MAG: 3-deoxy-D-manno-octulosonic acid transferase [Flavobacteriales bacterium]|nr:3-deoxy-D-manno-octulosonic acid transferase [Flavobacteriales bacterium]
MPLIYDLVTGAYHVGIRMAAPFVPKAREWVQGRKGIWERFQEKSEALNGCIWMHCASVGECEQGLPVLRALVERSPGTPVLLTFHSPSGFKAFKDHPLATHVDYLPPDGPGNAHRMIRMVRPGKVLFVRYEFWYHFLNALSLAEVPSYLVSSNFRADQPFFAWYGATWRRMLRCFTHLFVQDERSAQLLGSIGLKNVTICGDSRMDRVSELVDRNEALPAAARFRALVNAPLLVCGSTWPPDDDLIVDALGRMDQPPSVLIAPHEPSSEGELEIERSFPGPLVRWSALEQEALSPPEGARTCLLDRMGTLSRVYKYADIAYVGGGFSGGIHSVLEPAAWGRPVIFGPEHQKFPEAKGLIEAGGGFQVTDADELLEVLSTLVADTVLREQAGHAARMFVVERTGAAERMAHVIYGDHI